MARVHQINLSKGGVPKLPVPEALVTPLGLEGDAVRNHKYHGGPRQALLLIAKENLDALAAEGFPVVAGSLGENITVEGVDFRQMAPGQRWRAGDAILEITKARTPCKTLDVYNAGPLKIQTRLAANPGWGGYYVRVVQPGLVRRQDRIELLDQAV